MVSTLRITALMEDKRKYKVWREHAHQKPKGTSHQ